MPVTLTYPGVYIEEIPSGVRTITGVATSITAFIGRAKRGPTDEAKTINSFGDYERVFGGLDLNSTMSFAVRDFYLNGGAQAVIVRLFNPEKNDDGTIKNDGKTKVKVDALDLEAVYPGLWGNDLRVSIDLNASEEVANQISLTKTDLFNLTIKDRNSTEQYLNITVKGESERRIDKVLEAKSRLMGWKGDWPSETPEMEKISAAQDAEKKLADAITDEEKEAAQAELDEAKKDLDGCAYQIRDGSVVKNEGRAGSHTRKYERESNA
jgi:hypothetical protein